MSRVTSCLSAFVVLLAVCTATEAAYVPLLQNMRTGEAILADNFEGYDLHSAPNNCGPAAAYWGAPYVNDSTYGNSVGVWSNTYGGLTGGEGNQCLLLDRGSGACWITGYGDATKSVARDTVKASMLFYNFNLETSVYLNQGDKQLLQIGLYGSNGTSNPGKVKVLNPATGTWAETGFAFPNETAPAWTRLEVTHVNGTDQFAVSVNGGTPLTVTGNTAGNLDAIMFKPDGDHSTGLFDAVAAVPEPSTIALIGTGLIGLLAYAWRKRK